MTDLSDLLFAVCGPLFLIFSVVASTDGLYFHLYRYRLYRRPASRYEHRLHTGSALLFPPFIYLLCCYRPVGAYLWLAVLFFLLTTILETVDVLCESDSRADLGGLTPVESWMHFLMSALRWGASLPLLLAGGSAAYRLSATALLPRPTWFFVLGWTVVVPAIPVAVLHVYLDRIGRRCLVTSPVTSPAPRRR